MMKRILTCAPMAALLATTAVASPVWIKTADETEVKGRVTDVDPSGSQIVIEDQDRITIPPDAQVALADVRDGEMVDARYSEAGADKYILSLRVMWHDEQAP